MVEAETCPDELFEGRHVIEALYALLDARAYAEKSGEKLLQYLIEIAILEAQQLSVRQ